MSDVNDQRAEINEAHQGAVVMSTVPPPTEMSINADLLSVHLVVSIPQDPQVDPQERQEIVSRGLRSRLEACQPGYKQQAAVNQALEQHKAGRGNLHELEQGMRSDEQTQLGKWLTIAEQLPLRSGDGDIKCLWTHSGGPPPHDFVCVKVRLKAALVLLHSDVTERESNHRAHLGVS